MAVLLLAEVPNGALNQDATAKAVCAVKALGEVTVLCAGAHMQGAASQAAALAGVAKVLQIDSAVYEHHLAEPMAVLLTSLAENYRHIAAPATTDSKNILPRVAALLDVMIISDVCSIQNADTFERPAYAGNVIQTVQSTEAKKVFTIRTAHFEAVAEEGNAEITVVAPLVDPGLSHWVSDDVSGGDRPELTSAKCVVSGGRGLGSKENFALLDGLANKLGAAVGASRAAVDSGYAPNDWQVGQTGKVVAPELYMAFGISGAIQHIAGMKDSKVIVAINKDEDAPIFKIADYGIVGDLFTILPKLTESL